MRDSLPDGISGGVAPMSTPLSEMFMFTVENPRLSLMERRHLLDWEIRPALRTVAGVADVNVLGGYARTYQVSPLSAAMAQAGVSMAQLEQAIRDNNLNLGGLAGAGQRYPDCPYRGTYRQPGATGESGGKGGWPAYLSPGRCRRGGYRSSRPLRRG